MSDLMQWLYAHYIKPQAENQPKDDGEVMCFDLLKNDPAPYLEGACQTAAAFYTVQGFRLGLKTGLALGDELRE